MEKETNIKASFIILAFVHLISLCLGESIRITETPGTLPKDYPMGQYSPMLEFTYGDLRNEQYELKVWLLARGPWNCASGQWCEETFNIDNSDGSTPSGMLRVVWNMDVYNYGNLDWVARLYASSGVQVAWDEHYLDGVANRPPILSPIANQRGLVGEPLSFQTTATDPDGDNVSFSASDLPRGATLGADGNFIWWPSEEGEYVFFAHANDGLTYDSQSVTLVVDSEPAEDVRIEILSYPECGSPLDIQGVIMGTSSYDVYRIISYVFIEGSGWWTRPYSDSAKVPIHADGTFEVDLTTGGLDDLAEILYLAVCDEDTTIPILSGSAHIPDSLPVHDSWLQHRDMAPCHRTLEWSGLTWWVKTSRNGTLGPGSNYFDASERNVFVDESGALHLRIRREAGRWPCSEIVSIETFGYGTFEIDLAETPTLDKNAVFGLFTWESTAPNNREIDIEFSKWGQETSVDAQFVVQPWDEPGNRFRFATSRNSGSSVHSFLWEREAIQFQSVFGRRKANWTYTGKSIPLPHRQKVRMNLWLFEGRAPSDGEEQEVVIERFRWFKKCSGLQLDPALRNAIASELGIREDLCLEDLYDPKLRYLEVIDANITDLKGLEHAVHLETLNLPGNAISDLSPLAGLHQLTELDLAGNELHDIDPLHSLINLSSLNLSDNKIKDVNALSGLHRLEILQLNNNQISELSPLAGLNRLRWLEIEGNPLNRKTGEDLKALRSVIEEQNSSRLLHIGRHCPP